MESRWWIEIGRVKLRFAKFRSVDARAGHPGDTPALFWVPPATKLVVTTYHRDTEDTEPTQRARNLACQRAEFEIGNFQVEIFHSQALPGPLLRPTLPMGG